MQEMGAVGAVAERTAVEVAAEIVEVVVWQKGEVAADWDIAGWVVLGFDLVLVSKGPAGGLK